MSKCKKVLTVIALCVHALCAQACSQGGMQEVRGVNEEYLGDGISRFHDGARVVCYKFCTIGISCVVLN